MKDRMELLATLDANYLPRLKVMLVSLWMNNPGESFRLWLLHRGIPETELELLERQLGRIGCQLESRRGGNILCGGFPYRKDRDCEYMELRRAQL